ncbi:adenylyl cyclase-associated protein-like protein [Xylogone sp. PMI_703]|nr:adenylyl cyclase-associated protein-like protein [Xylogone sp. PMI_703]
MESHLTALLDRLEAATSRLEDMASSTFNPNGSAPTIVAPAPPPSASPLPPAPSAAPAPPAAPPKPVEESIPESIEEFDEFINSSVKKYFTISEEIGGAVGKQAASVLAAFEGQRKFLLITTKSKKPDMGGQTFMQLLKPLEQSITAVTEIREANRGSSLFNNLSAVSESIGVLAWITIEPKPHKHVEESLGSAQYWGNRVLKEYKDKDAKQVEWVQAYYQIFKDLTQYVQKTFPHGIPWNPKGVSAEEAIKQVESPQAGAPAPPPHPPAAGGPPPPPPGPPPPPVKFEDESKPAPAASGLNAVFSELNKGEAVTKGLRKVSASEMTHKNPSLRAGATVPTRSESQSSIGRGKSPAPPGKKPKPESMRTKKPPVKKLDGNKWFIENYENESQPIEIEATLQHSILISRCNKVTVMIKGKANAISVDNSPRLSLIVDTLVSSVDAIKSPNFALQVLGTLPTIMLDQVDGAQIYLSKESTHTDVYSSKCSSINLNIIEGEEEDYKEVPLPEQIRTYVNKDGKVVSEIVEHAG